ncbi:transmembrane protein 44 isoform X3 [Nycticebus coucang]|uniref:transmembrane protein 44 isoform X3 n=1 Tax=Nycticebus coucang TaxID=9470 RepID=UPI00234D02C9|nr:transmembrane protein 44 isoform X3 [Nycticebus coucang]
MSVSFLASHPTLCTVPGSRSPRDPPFPGVSAAQRLLYLRCAKKSGQGQSALCAACCLLTSLCNTIGAILARQLTIQVFTGAYLAAIDLLNFIFILFPVCGPEVKSSSDRGARDRKRRQRLRASVFALALPLSLGPCWVLWATVPKASVPVRGAQRRLLASLLQENTELLGYLLGSIAAVGSWASQIPPLSRICQGKTFSSIHLWTRLLSALAGLLYASAIVAHDRRPEYLLRAIPWFLTSLGRAALDLAIIFLSCVLKSKIRRALGFVAEAKESPDTQALLTCAEKEEENQEVQNKDKNSEWVPLTTMSHRKSLKTMAAISRYMELTIEPVQQAGCSATRLPGDGQTTIGDAALQEPPSYPPVQVIRARVSSSSSSEVSSINSDLEFLRVTLEQHPFSKSIWNVSGGCQGLSHWWPWPLTRAWGCWFMPRRLSLLHTVISPLRPSPSDLRMFLK